MCHIPAFIDPGQMNHRNSKFQGRLERKDEKLECFEKMKGLPCIFVTLPEFQQLDVCIPWSDGH